MSQSTKIQELQTELLQDFFEIQMTASFGDGWKQEVKNVVLHKLNTTYATYKEMKKSYDGKGVQGITVKDFDVTALAALMKFDFDYECCPDNYIKNRIARITLDRNGFCHISNYKDKENIFSLKETAIDNMKKMVTHLQSISWNYPQREIFFRKYLGTGHGDGLLIEIEQSVLSEKSSRAMCKVYIRHYLQELQIIKDEHEKNYVGLSYNLDGRKKEKKLLDELTESNLVNAQIGMRIVAEGGYGKSWTLFEIAGRYAEEYLESETEEERYIPVVIELGKLYKDCSSVRQKIAQLIFKGDESQVSDFLKNNKILLLVDAMDEAEMDIQSNVSRELASLHDTYSNIIMVCASRKSCIDKYPVSIPCYAIKELDDQQIVEYMEKAVPEKLREKAVEDWIGDAKKEFLSGNRTPFYICCYVDLICETGDNNFVDTTELIEKFLNCVIEREIRKTGFNSDKNTFINFLKELCRLLDNEERSTALPENDVVRELSARIIVEEGQASIKAVGKKLVEIQILSRDEEDMLISFAHQNYKEYINRKYPLRRFRGWK